MEQRDGVDTIMQEWARTQPALDVSPMAIVGRVSRLSRHFERSISLSLGSLQLHPWEFDVLATLYRADPPHRLTPTELFRSMMVTSGTMTHRIDRLENASFVVRHRDPRDRRGVLVQLTDAGRELVEKAVATHVDNERRLLAPLTRREQHQLADLLRKLLLQFESSDGR